MGRETVAESSGTESEMEGAEGRRQEGVIMDQKKKKRRRKEQEAG